MKTIKISPHTERSLMRSLRYSIKRNTKSVMLPAKRDEVMTIIPQLSSPQLDELKQMVVEKYSTTDKEFCIKVCKAISTQHEVIKLRLKTDYPTTSRLQERRKKNAQEAKNILYTQKHPIRIEYTPMGGQNGKTHH